MTIPAKRKSSSRTARGRSHAALTPARLIKCKNCGSKTLPHRVCANCGTYQGRTIITIKAKKKKPSK